MNREMSDALSEYESYLDMLDNGYGESRYEGNDMLPQCAMSFVNDKTNVTITCVLPKGHTGNHRCPKPGGGYLVVKHTHHEKAN